MFGGTHIEIIHILDDNYSYLLYDRVGGRAAIVDPGEPGPLLQRLFDLDVRLTQILLTHHHPDHTGGVTELLKLGTHPEVIGAAPEGPRLPYLTRALQDGERVVVVGEHVECLHTPGHTRGSAAYYMPQGGVVFTGDTLFLGGCGRLVDGTAAQLAGSLHKLAALRPATQIFCGHEYTEKNLRFACTVEPGNKRLLERLTRVQVLRSQGRPTVPGTIEEELATNPFLRCAEPAIQRRLGVDDEVAVLAELRRRKDRF